MATSVTITGTGCPIPDAHRAGPGALVRYASDNAPVSEHVTLQFDAGRGTVTRLAAANVWIPDLTAVFLTHYHSDHVSGLYDLVQTCWIMDRADQRQSVPVIAPNGASLDFASTLFDATTADIDVRAAHTGRSSRPGVQAIGFDAPRSPAEVWASDDGAVNVSASQVRHEPVVDAVGYRVDTPDGSVVITGDTKVCDEVAVLAQGCDVLVYEAMRFSFFDDLPAHRHFVMDYHADTKMLGAQAAEIGVPKLVLTHLIPAPTTDAERQIFVDEVRSGGYQGEVVVADDLYTCAVGDGGLPVVNEIVGVAEQD